MNKATNSVWKLFDEGIDGIGGTESGIGSHIGPHHRILATTISPTLFASSGPSCRKQKIIKRS